MLTRLEKDQMIALLALFRELYSDPSVTFIWGLERARKTIKAPEKIQRYCLTELERAAKTNNLYRWAHQPHLTNKQILGVIAKAINYIRKLG